MILSRFVRITATAALLSAAAVAFASCNDTASEHPAGTSAASNDPHYALIARGRAVYQSVCIACHNSDPKKQGSLGPEIWGSRIELLQARIMTASYPAGYTPKRTTHVMQPLPQVQKDIPAIEAYLNTP